MHEDLIGKLNELLRKYGQPPPEPAGFIVTASENITFEGGNFKNVGTPIRLENSRNIRIQNIHATNTRPETKRVEGDLLPLLRELRDILGDVTKKVRIKEILMILWYGTRNMNENLAFRELNEFLNEVWLQVLNESLPMS